MTYKVYKTNYVDGSFYIGFTSKTGKQLANYFGSNTTNKEIKNKEILYETTSKTDGKLYELIIQLDNINNNKCLNKMLNIRLRSDHIKALPKFRITFIQGE